MKGVKSDLALVLDRSTFLGGVTADILELLATQTALAEAQQERIRCVAEYRSARFRLLANSGVLGGDLD